MATPKRSSGGRPDVIIVGNGIIGLGIALELGDAGVRCEVYGASRSGTASAAAAGLLAPSIGNLSPVVRPFYQASLDRYPAFLDRIQSADPTLRINAGLIDLSSSRDERAARESRDVQRLDAGQLAVLEPALSATGAATQTAFFHPRDGAIDNVRLLAALTAAAASAPDVRLLTDEPVVSLDLTGPRAAVVVLRGARRESESVVLAAGAWSAAIGGLPRPLPVVPLKGQMLALHGGGLQHAVMGDDVYLVPRGSETLVGATTEYAGFDVGNTEDALVSLRAQATELCPALETAPMTRAWAGFRPASPDLLPILGRDPERPGLVYACGHSKNGILLAPATAKAIGDLINGQSSQLNMAPFAIERFGRMASD